MTQQEFELIENYMLSCIGDSAHDKEHIYRVLYVALDIAAHENNVDHDVLIAACLLHDIGRQEQFENPELCHAKIGSEKAYRFLMEHGWHEAAARHISECILSHRFRNQYPPETIEAKILFDSDKIDATGTLGIARTLFYKGQVSEPLYTVLDNEMVSDGSDDEAPSFFHEYKFKLEKLYDRFYTLRAMEIARKRQAAAVDFYNNMLNEVVTSYENGVANLSCYIK